MYYIEAETINGDGGILYDPEKIADEKRIVYDISTVEKELGRSGSFSFTVPKVNPLYDLIYRFGTGIKLYRKPGSLIFQGRVISVTRDLYLNKTVRCEGALGYLNDIIVRPFVYSDGMGHTFVKSPLAHYGELAKRYGQYCSEKRIIHFTTNIEDGDILTQDSPYGFAGVSEYVTVREAMDDILSLDDDLSLNVKYTGSTFICSLARLPYGTLDVSQTGVGIDLEKNMFDYSDEESDDDICTAIIPLGKDNRVMYDDDSETDLDSFTNTGLIEKYGRIEKVVHFDNANSDSKLKQSAQRLLVALGNLDAPYVTIRAVDLFHLGLNSDMIEIGYKIPLSSSVHPLYYNYMCTAESIDIENLENSSYTFRRIN